MDDLFGLLQGGDEAAETGARAAGSASGSQRSAGKRSPRGAGAEPGSLALKRQRDSTLTPYERERALAEGLSLETRARRKRELVQLRGENERLKEERAEFLAKIEQLQADADAVQAAKAAHSAASGEEGALLASENDDLRAQIDEHMRFIASFSALARGQPSESVDREELIYRDGAEAAQSYVLSLVSQSQAEWLRVRAPERQPTVLQGLQLSYATGRDLFGRTEKGVESRMSLRFDCLVKGVPAEVVADVFWRSFSEGEMQNKFYRSSGIVLRPIKGKMPDEDTRVVHYLREVPGTPGPAAAEHQHQQQTAMAMAMAITPTPTPAPKKQQDVVFVVNRARKLLAKSTLTPPRKTLPGKAAAKATLPLDDFGQTSAIVVATTSTTLYTDQELAAGDEDRARALVVKGAVVWAEGQDTRLVVTYSLPDTYKVLGAFNFADIVSERGGMSDRFQLFLEQVCADFTATIADEAAKVREGMLTLPDLPLKM
jgi:hypothetical protein